MFAIEMKKGNIIINAAKGSDSVDIRLYGNIGDWGDVNGNRLSGELSKYEGKYKTLNIYLNSNGGSVIEGIALFNILKRTKMEVNIYVDGVAASMGSVLLQLPNAKRYMARFTRVMVHRVAGMAMGSVDDLRGTADMMEGFEADMITIIAERTGKTIEAVKADWFDGKDHWFTPEQALKAKLIDGIVDGKLKKEASNMSAVPELMNFYNEQITNYNQHFEKMDLSNLINLTGVPAGSDLAAIEAKVQEMTNQAITLSNDKAALEAKVADFEQKAKADKDQRVKELVDNAIASKKFTEANREAITNLAKLDFDSAKATIEAISTPQNLRDFANGGGSDSPIAEDRKSWSFQEWQKKDGKGLVNLKANHPELYKDLYDKAFPKA